MHRPIHVAVRGAVSDVLQTALATEYGMVVGEDADTIDCTLATVDALDTLEGRDERDGVATGARGDGLGVDGATPVIALCPEPSTQASALAAGADRCVTLADDSATDAANVAAVVERVLADGSTERDVLLRESLDVLADFFFLFDTELRLLVWNDAVTAVTGYTDEELDEMNPLDLISEEDVVEVATAVQRAIQSGRATEEGDVLTKAGERIPYEFTGTALTGDDGEVLGVCGTGRDVSERHRRERTLERQAESLRTLNRINEVIRDINQDLVRAETRADVERAVVERLATDDAYRFAWVGEYNASDDRVMPRVWAGRGESYLDARDRLTFEDDVTAMTAIRDRSTQVVQHLAEGADESWGDAAVENGFASAIAIPLVYHDVAYGTLCVYSERPDAFEGTERAVFGELGETIGYAIGAAERRRALLTDTVVELEILVETVEGLPSAVASADSTVEFRGAVPNDDGSLSQFYRVDGDFDAVVDAVRADDTELSVVRTDEEGGVLRVVGDGTLNSLLADFGGTVERVDIEDGGLRIVATFPQRTDVRKVLEAVRGLLPGSELVARRERERDDDGVGSDVALTDRQRTVLTTAYHLGFFDSPRANTGGDVAEELDISTPTFHEHIRIAERKLVEAFLATSEKPPT